MEAAQDNRFYNLELVISRVDDTDIRSSFVKVYQDAGIITAFDEFDNMTGKKARRYVEMPDGERVDIRARWLAMLEGIVLDETIPAMGAVMTTSREIFTDFVDNAVREGLSANEIAKGLRKRWDELLPWRSFNIARTETLSALNYGQDLGADATGYRYRKTWLTAMDGRQRDAHGAMNGKSINQGEKFFVDGESLKFPGDPAASAANRVNCRCTVTREVI